MSLTRHLAPSNSVAAKSTAHNTFLRFLEEEQMTPEEAHESIVKSVNGRGIAVIMDKFAIFLAFSPGKKGERLAKNTVDQYFGQVKTWLLECYPDLRGFVQPDIHDVGKRIKRYCTKRLGGVVVRKAPACRKTDLRGMLGTVYRYGSSSSDYLDGLLLVWLWHLFGRSSDLNSVLTSNLSVYPGGALFVQFTRPKTADETGLSLFRDSDAVTCPINALALAMIMKTSSELEIFTQIPRSGSILDEDTELMNIPLRDLLDAASLNIGGSSQVLATLPKIQGVASPTVHGYVNRLIEALRRRAEPAAIRDQLTSHSFRRGGAQDANGNSKLSAQWIFDRGSWNMSATNKGFGYITNTTQEDQKIAKHLSGWDPEAIVSCVDLTIFDGVVATKIQRLEQVLFSGCNGLDQDVRSVLMASVIFNYPDIISLQEDPEVGAAARIRRCMQHCDVTEHEVLAWRQYLRVQQDKKQAPVTSTSTTPANTSSSLDEIVKPLLAQNRLLQERLDKLEDLVLSLTAPNSVVNAEVESHRLVESKPKKQLRVRKSARKGMKEVWVEWRTFLPPLYASNSHLSKQQKHEYKMVVAYMSIFLPDGFVFNDQDPDFKRQVENTGSIAELGLLSYLRENGIDASSLGTVVKAMRELQKTDELKSKINSFRSLVEANKVVEHLPVGYQAVTYFAQVPTA